MPTIRSTSFSAIDFESAGAARGRTDVPVQVGTTTWCVDEGVTDTWMSYIQADRPITWAAQKVHGITKDDLEDAPKMMLLWPQFKKRLNKHIVVAHGHGTEKRFLRAFPGHGFGPWVDTLLLARSAWPELDSHTLGDLCETFDLTDKVSELVPDKTWHDALYDAAASILLLKHFIATFKLEDKDTSVLLSPDTSTWHKLKK